MDGDRASSLGGCVLMIILLVSSCSAYKMADDAKTEADEAAVAENVDAMFHKLEGRVDRLEEENAVLRARLGIQ